MSANDLSMDLAAPSVAAASLATPDSSIAEWLRTLTVQIVSLDTVKIGGVLHKLETPVERPAPAVVTNSGKRGDCSPMPQKTGAPPLPPDSDTPGLASSRGTRRKSLPPARGVVPHGKHPPESDLGPFALSDKGAASAPRDGENTGATSASSVDRMGQLVAASAVLASDDAYEPDPTNKNGASAEGGAQNEQSGDTEIATKESTITFRGEVLDIEKLPAHVQPILRDPASNRSQYNATYRGTYRTGDEGRWKTNLTC